MSLDDKSSVVETFECTTDSGQLLSTLQAKHEFPLTAVFVATERCNLSCPHCFVPHPFKETDRLSIAEVVELFDQLVEAGTLRLIITGGEPFLRPDMNEIIEQAAARRFSIVLKTNCGLLDKSAVEHLWKVGVSELSTSLYYDSPQKHDEFVGAKGSWQAVIDALEVFSSFGGICRVGIVVMNWNTERVIPLMNMCDERGWLYHVDSRVTCTTSGDMTPCAFRAGEKEILPIYADERFTREGLPATDRLQKLESRVCAIGYSSSCIMPNGDIRPCIEMPLSLGNIREDSYRNIWLNSPIRRQVREIRWRDSKECVECEFVETCSRCPAASYNELGDVNQPVKESCCLLSRVLAKSCNSK
jgi:AdoMet-dependent heme synthase